MKIKQKIKAWLLKKLLAKKTALEMCAIIDDWSFNDRNESHDLWCILTALRGPDYSGYKIHGIKIGTTCVLREVVFPNFTNNSECAISKPIELFNEDNACADTVGLHFLEHWRMAVQVIPQLKKLHDANKNTTGGA